MLVSTYLLQVINLSFFKKKKKKSALLIKQFPSSYFSNTQNMKFFKDCLRMRGWGEGPRDHPRFYIPWDWSFQGCNLFQQKDTKENQHREKVPEVKYIHNYAQALSIHSLLVEPHHSELIPPARSCNSTYEMFSTS